MTKQTNQMTKKECMEELNVAGVQYKAKASISELRSLVESTRNAEPVVTDAIETTKSADAIATEIVTKKVEVGKVVQKPNWDRIDKEQRMKFMEDLIASDGGWKLKDLVEITFRYFPNCHPETLRTNLYDSQNEKYNPFSRPMKIVKEENRGRVVYFA
jgi:hypothetical protein